MISLAANPIVSPAAAATSPRFWMVAAACVLGTAFFLTEHNVQTSLHDAFTQTAAEMEATAAGGNSTRRLAYLVVAALGVAGFVAGRAQAFRATSFLAVLLLAYAAWCGISVLWSDDASMTVRRYVLLVCFGVGAAGVSRVCTLRDLLRIGLIVSTAYLAIGVLSEIRFGTFRPWAGDYRFSGSLHPNTQGLNLAVLCFSSFSLAGAATKRRTLLIALCATGLLFLVLTKSRTACAGVLGSLGSLWVLRRSPRLVFGLATLVVWCACTVALVVLTSGLDVESELRRVMLLGREDQAESLTGRLPIWTEVAPHVAARPLVGYGYDSFWTPQRIDAVSSELHWGIREAHSAYLDSLLSVGLCGTLLFLAIVAVGMFHAARNYLRTGEAGYGFYFALMLFGLIDGFSESGMTMPMFVPFLCACGLIRFACGPAADVAAESADSVATTVSESALAAHLRRPASAMLELQG